MDYDEEILMALEAEIDAAGLVSEWRLILQASITFLALPPTPRDLMVDDVSKLRQCHRLASLPNIPI